MEIIVIGAGAIGSLIGARLAGAHKVTLIGRPEHVRAIEHDGLRIEGLEQSQVAVRAVERVDSIEANTLVLLTTKVFDTKEALEPLAHLVREDTTLVVLQNGLGGDEIARAVLGKKALVLRGITQLGAILKKPGYIRYMVKGETLLESHERSAQVATLFKNAGLDCRVSPDIQIEVWRKLIFNCLINPLTSILASAVGGIAIPELRPVKQLIVDECLAVAQAEGVSLPDDFMSEVDALYGESPNTVSMRQDLERGRRTEINYLNGAIVARGERHGLQCPVNRALTAIIHALEAQKIAT